MTNRSEAAKKGAATKKQIQKAAKDAHAVSVGGAAIASLAVADAAEAVRTGLVAQPDLCLVVHHCLMQGTLRPLLMAPRPADDIRSTVKNLGQSTRKFKNMPLYLIQAAVARISPLTMKAWQQSEDEDWCLVDGLAHVLHASRETVLPHVGHPELAAMPRFLQAIGKRYEDMGRRCHNEVWSKSPVHWTLNLEDSTVKFKAGESEGVFKVFLPVPAPADVSILNPESACKAQVVCPSMAFATSCIGLATLECNSDEYSKVKGHLIPYEEPWNVYNMEQKDEPGGVTDADSISMAGSASSQNLEAGSPTSTDVAEALKRKALEQNGRSSKVARLPSRKL
eukprot:6455731-Amphidinium_carterae.1